MLVSPPSRLIIIRSACHCAHMSFSFPRWGNRVLVCCIARKRRTLLFAEKGSLSVKSLKSSVLIVFLLVLGTSNAFAAIQNNDPPCPDLDCSGNGLGGYAPGMTSCTSTKCLECSVDMASQNPICVYVTGNGACGCSTQLRGFVLDGKEMVWMTCNTSSATCTYKR